MRTLPRRVALCLLVIALAGCANTGTWQGAADGAQLETPRNADPYRRK